MGLLVQVGTWMPVGHQPFHWRTTSTTQTKEDGRSRRGQVQPPNVAFMKQAWSRQLVTVAITHLRNREPWHNDALTFGHVNLCTKWLKNCKAKCNDQPAVRHWKLLMKYTNTGLHRDTLPSDFCLFKIILPYHVHITQPGSFCLSFRSEDGPCAALLRRKQV